VKIFSPTVMDVEETINTTAVFITAGMELGDTVHEGQL
jgi:hypothetical protein